MDVLLDTNAVIGAGLEKPAFRSLREYLSRTQSSLLVPAVVLEELLAQKETTVHQIQRDLHNAFRAVKRVAPATSAEPPHLDIEAIVSTERARVLAAADEVIILENNGEEDLPELVRRLAHRVPPASKQGEEARDVLIWLAARRRLAAAPLALITADSGFVSGPHLRPELKEELGAAATHLVTYRSLDDFLARHHARVSSITEDWVSKQMSEEHAHEAMVEAIDQRQWLLDHLIERLGEPTGYLNLVQIVQHEIRRFFVSDLPENELYVGVTVWAELEIEVEFYPEPEDGPLLPRARTKCIYPCVEYDVQLEVRDEKVVYAVVTRVELA